MAEQQYSAEDIQNALQAGVISPEDAQYLMESIEPQTSGAAMGTAALGGLAGAGLGALAGAPGKKLGARLEQMGAKQAGDWANSLGPKAFGAEINKGTYASGGLGALAGGAAGGFGGLAGGEAMFPGNPGSGVQASPPDEEGNLDYDSLLAILVDPNVPGDVKKQAMQLMQQMNQDGGSAGAGEADSFPWGAAGGGAAGAGLGSAAGMFGGNAAGARMAEGAENGAKAFMGRSIPGMGGKLNPTGLALGGLGMLAGGAAGAMGGSMLDPAERYRDPYGA